MTPDTLQQCVGCTAQIAAAFAKPITDACQRFQINTPQRQAAFLAEMAFESEKFAHLEENLYYRSAARLVAVWPSKFKSQDAAQPYTGNPEKLANFVYAYRNGNGSESSGDGWRYRGRGLVQLTGKANYSELGFMIGEPITAHPDLIATPPYAALAAGWFWSKIGANGLADAGDLDAITRRINGAAMLGKDERWALYRPALAVLET